MKSLAFLSLMLIAAGCTRPLQDLTPAAPPKAVVPIASGSPVPSGSISGRVTWTGDAPDPQPITGLIGTPGGSARWGQMPNHLAPKIDVESKGMAGAVVHLKECDPKLAKPWPYGPLRIEQRDRTIRTTRDSHSGRTGFVRVGEPFDMISFDDDYHMLRARGAGFFTLPFPEPNKPLTRAIDAAGRTEFTSAAGDFWSSADVYSCEHPYYTTTDETGRFTLDGVPPGKHTLVARHPNWKLEHFERDPESGKIMRLQFENAFVVERGVDVKDGTVRIDLSLPK